MVEIQEIMAEIDPFTKKRLIHFVETHRAKTGQLPTVKDFSDSGFDEDLLKVAIKKKIIEQFYVTLTSGTIVKCYKLFQR